MNLQMCLAKWCFSMRYLTLAKKISEILVVLRAVVKLESGRNQMGGGCVPFSDIMLHFSAGNTSMHFLGGSHCLPDFLCDISTVKFLKFEIFSVNFLFW